MHDVRSPMARELIAGRDDIFFASFDIFGVWEEGYGILMEYIWYIRPLVSHKIDIKKRFPSTNSIFFVCPCLLIRNGIRVHRKKWNVWTEALLSMLHHQS